MLGALGCGAGEQAPSNPTAPVTEPAPASEGTGIEEQIAALKAIGYVGGVEEAPEATPTVWRAEGDRREGLNLYVSGHAPMAALIDMDGHELHAWSHRFEDAFPDASPAEGREAEIRGRWRRAYLLADGGLLAIFEGQGIVRLDRASRLVWRSALRAHHAAHLQADGRLFVLTRVPHVVPRLNPKAPILEDFVSVLDVDTGELIEQRSVLEAFERSRFRDLIPTGPKRKGDLFHTNAIEVLDGRFAALDPAFRAGHVLLSSRTLDAVFVMDMHAGEIVWLRTGSWKGQHDPRTLEEGRILLFDNHGEAGRSRVLEISLRPGEEQREWVVYEGSAEAPFFTMFCGAAQRLEGGHTLITETARGRAFEVDAAGEIVWEFRSPHRVGASGELIAQLYDLSRVEVEGDLLGALRAPVPGESP